jgi:hypothetical protein
MKVTSTTRKLTRFRYAATLLSALAAAAPALLLAGVGTAHADDPCYGDLAGSYYCSPASGASNPQPAAPIPAPSLWNALPQCTGGVLAALDGEC